MPAKLHSPLGASSAERWINCPGSVRLIQALGLPPSDEPDYRLDGTTAHAGASYCLERSCDTWEIVGTGFDGQEFTPEMGEAVQEYLDVVRACATETSVMLVEQRVARTDIHIDYFGTLDSAVYETPDPTVLDVFDYKHGKGVVVEVENNPQVMYYSFGLLGLPDLQHVQTVRHHIIQPRAWHPDGIHRVWEVSADYVRAWTNDTLLPAMQEVANSELFDVGPWCRFCPAKLVCPMMRGLYGAALKADIKRVIELTDEELGHDYVSVQAVKQYIKAIEEAALMRLMQGRPVSGVKLVPKKSDRVWKPEAQETLEAAIGEGIYGEPKMLTPFQMEKQHPEIAGKVKELAYTPNTGYTVALESDKRPTVKVSKPSETFSQWIKEAQNDG